jgi:hypothetical protein
VRIAWPQHGPESEIMKAAGNPLCEDSAGYKCGISSRTVVST